MEFIPRCGLCKFFKSTPLEDFPFRGKCSKPNNDREMVDATWIPYTKQKDSKKSVFNPNSREFEIKRDPCFEILENLEIQEESSDSES